MFDDLHLHESRHHSQNGEDGVLARLLALVGETNRYFVEFGVGTDAQQCNTRLLANRGWDGLWMDCCDFPNEPRIHRESVTAENINDLFTKYGVPNDFDVLSIDIDGNDFWVWKAIDPCYRPRVIIAEYNAAIPPHQSLSIAYDPKHRWDRTDYFGASLLALAKLAEQRGYTLVYCESTGTNAFFVRNDLTKGWTRSVTEIYRSPNYAKGLLTPRWLAWLIGFYWPTGIGHRHDPRRRMIEVS